MKLVPVASRHAVGADIAPTNNNAAKDRAVNAFMSGKAPAPAQAQEMPVINPSAVSPEEMTAVKPKTSDEIPTTESSQVVTETQAPTEEPTTPEDPIAAKQYAQLARQEKALRAKQLQQNQAFAKREAELKAREEALNAKDSQYNQGYISKDDFAKNPLKYLTEAGHTYDALTQQMLDHGALDPRVEAHISKLEAKIAQLEQSNEKAMQQRKEEADNSYKQAVAQIKRDVTKLVDTDETYETIKATGSYDDVVELIEKTYQEDGVLLTNDEAAQMVEDYLIEEAMKITKIGKIKSKLNLGTKTETESNKQQTQKPKTEQQQDAPKMKTLTNAVTASRPLSARERAIAKFKGEKV